MDWQRLIPRYWFQNGATSYEWDDILNKALDQYGVSEVGQHTCKVGPVTVWIANWPYGYGYAYGDGYPNLGIPTVRTRKRLRDAVKEAIMARVRTWPDGSRLRRVN